MEWKVSSGTADKQRTACLVTGFYKGQVLSPVSEQLDATSNGFISGILKRCNLHGEPGQTLLLHNVPGVLADRVLLVGLGDKKSLCAKTLRKCTELVVRYLNEAGSMEAAVYFKDAATNLSCYESIRVMQEASSDALYSFSGFTSKESNGRRPLKRLTFCVPRRRDLKDAENALFHATALSAGKSAARHLGNLPPNVLTPTGLALRARELASQHESLNCTTLGEEELARLGMGAWLAVSRGSANESQLIRLDYRQADDPSSPPIVLIGKGLTFDAGGITLKGSNGMDEMKCDMCGAAAVFGTMLALAELGLPVNVTGILAACENMPDGNAYRPGDVLTTMSGKTIEVLSTDAEGRLVLADAITYTRRMLEPKEIIDVATLTGAAITSLGHVASAMMTNDKHLGRELKRAAKTSGDRVWPLPVDDDYQPIIDSHVADMKNTSWRIAGAVGAACLLSRFAEETPWVHLDIAGTAWLGRDKGATGRPVPLLVQYLIHQCGA
ncbi:leucyl aminopeptidase [Parasalinivibrio latis]|uniref:leucyl aminopeptidase n=1 Tax=Parasalinivibrio latis TaxID=2952610 RepID=UPI0030E11BA7